MNRRNQQQPIRFPVRLHGYDRVEIIRLSRNMGPSAKVWLREIAKELPEYHQPIECAIAGRTDTGQSIPINNVGRWLFGVPGYMGHIRVSNWDGLEARVEWPSQSPHVVHELIARLKAQVERSEYHPPAPGDELERARQLVEERKPSASIYHKAAFANSVQELVTGWAGGYGGPSVRQYAAVFMYSGRRYSFEEAAELLLRDDGPIFGPITEFHREIWDDYPCFDDDPRDVEELGGPNFSAL